MTTPNDYLTLLAEQTPYADDLVVARNILTAFVPWLCPDCKGSGYTYGWDDGVAHGDPCGHALAPTIADLLRWGENVARHDSPLTVLHTMDGTPVPDKYDMTGRDIEVLTNAAIAALRTEADQ